MECYQILCKEHWKAHNSEHKVFIITKKNIMICRECKVNLGKICYYDSKLNDVIREISKIIGIYDLIENSEISIFESNLEKIQEIMPKIAENEEEKKSVSEGKIETKSQVRKKSDFENLFGPMSISEMDAVKGLENIGNTCYLNSVLQCLNVTRPFVENIINKLYDLVEIDSLKEKNLHEAMREFFIWFRNKTEKICSPKILLSNIQTICHKFEGFKQQDSFELLLTILDQLLTEQSKFDKLKSLNFIELPLAKIFGSHLVNKIHCLECKKTAWKFDPCLIYSIPIGRSYYAKSQKNNKRGSNYNKHGKKKFNNNKTKYYNDISPEKLIPNSEPILVKFSDLKISEETKFPLQQIIQSDNQEYKVCEPINKPQSNKTEEEIYSLSDCLDLFFSKEILCSENLNPINCQFCNSEKSHKIREFYVANPPPILIIQLKRFINTPSGLIKNTKRISVPINLNLDNFCLKKTEDEKCKYSLYAIISHSGDLNGGHYVAYVKWADNKYFFNLI